MIDYGRNHHDTRQWADRDGTLYHGDTRNGSGGRAGEQEEIPPDSWAPVDLVPYLRGEVVQPEPTIGLTRTDGLRVLYPGREHSVIGEMESGKSWFALGCASAELNAGHHVVYIHFEEADPTGTVDRLIALGVRDSDILRLFRFVGPERRVDQAALAGLLDPAPSLVVLDGVNEAMALHRWGIREEDGAAEFRRQLVKPCTRVGAAVCSLDHVVKDSERRGRLALGSVHKGNGLSGSLILLENAEPFGRQQRGRSHVYLTKDRPGFLRRRGRPDRGTPGKTYLGEFVIDDTHQHVPCLEMAFYAPKQDQAASTATRAAGSTDDKVFEAVLAVVAAGQTANVRRVRASAGLGNTVVSDGLTRLAMAGRLVESDGPRGAKVYAPTTSTGSHDPHDG